MPEMPHISHDVLDDYIVLTYIFAIIFTQFFFLRMNKAALLTLDLSSQDAMHRCTILMFTMK